MINLSHFPVKQLFLRVFTITILVVFFKLTATKLNTRNTVQSSQIARFAGKKFHLNAPEKTLAMVEKLNASIEELAFLLSEAKKNDLNLTELMDLISLRIEEIEKRAENECVKNLIDLSLISELKNNIQVYQTRS